MVHPVNPNNKVVLIDHKKKHKILTDHQRVVFGFHYLEDGNVEEALSTLGQVNQSYWTGQFHKDIARALLCHLTYPNTGNPQHGEESEFYLVVYKLTKLIIEGNIHFNGSGNIRLLKDELFKGLM